MNALTYTIATILIAAFTLGSLITAPAIQMSSVYAKSSGTATGDSGKGSGSTPTDSPTKKKTEQVTSDGKDHGCAGCLPHTTTTPTVTGVGPTTDPDNPDNHCHTAQCRIPNPHDDGCTDAGDKKCPPGGPTPFPFPKLPKNCHETSPDHILCIVHGRTIVKHTTQVINQAAQIQTVNFKETLTSKNHNVQLAAPTKKFIDSVGTLHIVGQVKNVSAKAVHITSMTAQVSASGTVLGVAATLPTPKDIAAGQSSAFEFVIGGINAQLVDLAQYFVS